MNLAERFWWLMTIAVVAWYSTVTIYVAIKGAIDIKSMLKRLEDQHGNNNNDAA